jgi:hypothetical protein
MTKDFLRGIGVFIYTILISQFVGLIYVYFRAFRLTIRYEDIVIDETAFAPALVLAIVSVFFAYIRKAKKYFLLFCVVFFIHIIAYLIFMFSICELLSALGA